MPFICIDLICCFELLVLLVCNCFWDTLAFVGCFVDADCCGLVILGSLVGRLLIAWFACLEFSLLEIRVGFV